MHRILTTAFAAMALGAAALLTAGVADAAPAEGIQVMSVASQTSTPSGGATPTGSASSGATPTGSASSGATPTGSASSSGPVDPGTGETREAKETRVDYAPYVIGAAVVVVLVAAAVVLRRRGGPSSKGPRRDA
jgi:hypothetical protein